MTELTLEMVEEAVTKHEVVLDKEYFRWIRTLPYESAKEERDRVFREHMNNVIQSMWRMDKRI